MPNPPSNSPSSDRGSKSAGIGMGREFFPMSGSGRIRRISDSRGQGMGSMRAMGRCQACGLPNDLRKIDTGGGTEDGNGAYSGVTTTTTTATTLAGASISDTYSEGNLAKGGGCALCGTKNAAREAPSPAR